MEKQGKSRTLNFVKKSCRILSGILNWNVETSVKELGRLNEAHRSFAFVHLAVIVFTGLCSAGKYGCGEDEFLIESDRKILVAIALITSLSGFIQSAKTINLGRDEVRKVTSVCEVCTNQLKTLPSDQTKHDPLSKYRILNSVFIPLTTLLALINFLTLWQMDAWNTELGMLIGCYTFFQLVLIGFYCRGALSGMSAPTDQSSARMMEGPLLDVVTDDNTTKTKNQEFPEIANMVFLQ